MQFPLPKRYQANPTILLSFNSLQNLHIHFSKQSISPSAHLINIKPQTTTTPPPPKPSTPPSQMENHLTPISKYTKRVVLKSFLGRHDGGSALIGEKIIVGGWVKSSKEMRKEQTLSPGLPAPAPVEPGKAPAGKGGPRCTEILHMPFVRSLLKALHIGPDQGKSKLEEDAVHRLRVLATVVLEISDGSCASNLQVVVDSSVARPAGDISLTGTCILVEGVVQEASFGAGKHLVEVKAENLLHLGVVDHERYPLSMKRLPLDSLRDWPHLRPRTTTVASITRISNALTHATHKFFHDNSFLHIRVPIITTTDCKGLGKKFHVTTLLNKPMNDHKEAVEGISLESVKASIKQKSAQVEELQRTDSNREALIAALRDLKKANELVAEMEAQEKAVGAQKSGGSVGCGFEEDFFGCEAYLTVSGRLHLESYACAHGNVYSFGPRFKAETSPSAKEAVEAWKVEAEMAFAEVEEALNCAVDYLKFLCKWVLDNCSDDMKFVLKRIDKTAIDRLQSLTSSDFDRVSYTEAVDALKQVTGKKFGAQVEWGAPLSEEHERYLADEIYKKALIVYDHPREIKPFYVRLNDDGKTVATFDILAPKVGVLIRGSQNEERLNMLSSRIEELGLPTKQYEWYLDLRRHGTVKHAGFSLGFDSVTLLATGITNVDNVIPFPRSYGKAPC